MKNPDNKHIGDQQILSQKFSQLLNKDVRANDEHRNEDEEIHCHNKRPLQTLSPEDTERKKFRQWYDNDHEESEEHPMSGYFNRLNDIFEKMMTHQMLQNQTHLSINDLHELAILQHRIAMIEIDKKLWTFYLKLGTGQCDILENNITEVDPCIWPTAVRKMRTNPPNTTNSNGQIIKEKSYEAIVYDHLENLNEKIEFYSAEYYEKSLVLIHFKDAIEKGIQTFVQTYSIVPFEMKFNYKVKILTYNYTDQLLERDYFRRKTNDNQIKLAQHLYDSRAAYVQAKRELIQLKHRILCNKPTQMIYGRALSMFSTQPLLSNMDAQSYQRNIDQEEKELQNKMTDLTIECIIEMENKILQCRATLHKAIQEISTNDKEFPTDLMDIIHRRVDIINKKVEYCSNFRIQYCLHHNYTDLPDSFAIPSHCFSPTMIIGTAVHLLTKEQLQLLNRGPTYVPPYQMYVSSTNGSLEEIIKKQFKSLQYDLNNLFTKRQVNMAVSAMIKQDINKLFTDTFSISLPNSLRRRALYEQYLIETIRQHLKDYDLILRRTADQENVFYLAYRTEFEQKTTEFMTETDIFQLCHIIDEKNLRATRDFLTTKIKSINERVQTIFSKEEYKKMQEKLYVTIDKVKLPYLYFLPHLSRNAQELLVQPVITSTHSATALLARFLDDLLRTSVQMELDSTTFHNGTDFIRKLNDYVEQPAHHLRSTTMFVTMTIRNFYAMVDHDTWLFAFQDFLNSPCRMPTIQGISLAKVYQLTTLFLRNNLFYYDHKIYRFSKGSPFHFPITETLALIYILRWFKSLFRKSVLEKEFYGRRVYHDASTVQKYTLPYVVGNSKMAHSHWLRSSLIRAVRYCTSVNDFNQERIYLEVSCLANGYSLEFIEKHIDHFFTHFDAVSLRSVLDQQVYMKLRHRLFNFVSEQRQIFRMNKELEEQNQRFHLSYLCEYGPKQKFNEELQKMLSKSLNSSKKSAKMNTINLRFTTQSSYSLNAFLGKQKPYHPLFYEKKL
ncbi:unnamed protein product [Rotaria sp. Silwood1]|nr:unnamed protein product [Rotaria sp. Silwood1]